jgi:hypothetical protein
VCVEGNKRTLEDGVSGDIKEHKGREGKGQGSDDFREDALIGFNATIDTIIPELGVES